MKELRFWVGFRNSWFQSTTLPVGRFKVTEHEISFTCLWVRKKLRSSDVIQLEPEGIMFRGFRVCTKMDLGWTSWCFYPWKQRSELADIAEEFGYKWRDDV